MTLIRAECSMISAQDDLSVRSGQDRDGWIGRHHSGAVGRKTGRHFADRALWVPC
jgi:hypothetical protein